MPAAKILLETFNETRNLSLHYFNKLKGADINRSFEVDGVPFNSAKWIMAHLVWAEHFLILEAFGAQKISQDWFDKVAFGSPMCPADELPEIDTILASMKKIHAAVNGFVPELSDDFLEGKNELGLKFGTNESKHFMLIHAIRHEGTHAGHLGWLCKLNGLRTP